MNTIKRLCVWGLMTVIFSCDHSPDPAGTFVLLPGPQQFDITGTSSIRSDDLTGYYAPEGTDLPAGLVKLAHLKRVRRKSEAPVSFSINEAMDLKNEGYVLDIEREQVIITGKDRAGLLYGFKTLEQLFADAEEQDVPLPMCHIKDYPLLKYRAIHLDMKHHMEKREYYYRLMDKLAAYKINAIIAEVEDKLGYRRQPLVGSADALSIAEWKKLSDYALERNIEISPLVQGLGHASFILKHEAYKPLRDDPESDWAFNPLDPGTYRVQFDLYLDAMEAMPHGKYLHVGGDEVHTTGRGSGKSELELQLAWLNQVCTFTEEHGRIPVFWDDMPIKFAGLYAPMFDPTVTREEVEKLWQEKEYKLLESLDQFPKNCVYMRWNYSAPRSAGNIKAMEWFTGHGFQVMGATAGQTRWILMPRNESNMENIRSFAVSSIEKGLDGLLLTLWDDDSPHFELYMRGIIAFAEYSWSGDRRSRAEIKSAYRHREYAHALSDSAYGFVDQLEPAVGWWNGALLQSGRRNELRSMVHPEEAVIALPFSGEKGNWSVTYAARLERAAAIQQLCDETAATIAAMKSETRRNIYRLEVYEQVNALVRFTAHALLTLQTYDLAQSREEMDEALQRVRKLPGEFAGLRAQLEQVYGKTRVLDKPAGYLLDQDHHHHLANQTIPFDWLFTSELFFLEKLRAGLGE